MDRQDSPITNWLEQAKSVRILWETKEDMIIERRESTMKTTANYENIDSGKSDGSFNSTSKKLEEYVDYKNKTEKEIYELKKIHKEIEETINCITNYDAKAVLFRKYILFEQRDDIIKRLYISKTTYYRLLELGIKKVGQIRHFEIGRAHV